jgi:hypothetical protein
MLKHLQEELKALKSKSLSPVRSDTSPSHTERLHSSLEKHYREKLDTTTHIHRNDLEAANHKHLKEIDELKSKSKNDLEV